MRFSHFLKYNAVPEWQGHYMSYNDLKNSIYSLQTDELQINDHNVQTVEEDEDESSSSKDFTKKWKNKIFSGKGAGVVIGNGNGKRAGGESVDELAIKEETFELEDMQTGKYAKKAKSAKNLSFQKVKDKFFDSSRRSSTSSDSKTLSNTYDTFVNYLTTEKVKVDDFYKRSEAVLYEKFDTLVKDLEKQGLNARVISDLTSVLTTNTTTTTAQQQVPESFVKSVDNESRLDIFSEEDLELDEEDDDFDAQDNTALLHYSQFNINSQKKSLLKQTIINLYIDLSQLKSFIELNKMGFSKIAKKADKVLNLNIREELILSEEFFKDTYVFQFDTVKELNLKITRMVEFYAAILGNTATADDYKMQLKQFLHDHIVWERSNTWRDMLGLYSYSYDDDDKNKYSRAHLQLEYFKYPLPWQIHLNKPKLDIENILIPKLFLTRRAFKIAFVFVVTAILLGIKTFNDPAEHRCMALVACVAFLWASEALPLFITALLVPLLAVLFKVLKNSDGSIMAAKDASATIFAAMWSSTLMILLAGFTLSAALAKYDVAKVLASWLLAFAGTKPRNVLLMAMSVVFFLSMWISNVASPVLTYSLMKPLLDQLDASNPFGKALVLCVALAANLGGMASPISSPQNIISMQYLTPYGIGWGQFFAVALPIGILSLLLIWIFLFISFDINKTKIERFVAIRTEFTLKQYYVIVVAIATIILWCVESQIESAFGSSGVIAILPIVLFFGTGLLAVSDLNAFPWSIILLAMGGISLGKAVSSSGLLATIAGALQRKIDHDTTLAVLCIFGVLMLVVGTFVSHTVSAIIIVPLVQQVGNELSSTKAAPILVFGCTLLSSAGMGLASSGFPNITAISTLDRHGNPYLDMRTFILRGVPASLIVFVCVITLGYGIMSSILHDVVTAA